MTYVERFEQLTARKQMAVLLLIGFILLFLTTPLNLVRGYLLAEEGSTYLRYARSVSPLHALLAIHQGYYSLVPNVTMLLPARFLPIVTAAWIGEWTGLLFRLWTVYFLATCESIRSARARLIAVVLVMVLPGAANVVGCISVQFYLGAIAAIVLLSDPAKRVGVRAFALVLGGLTSPASSLLLPLFVWRAWKMRTRPAYLQAFLVLLSTAFQFAMVHIAGPYERGHPIIGAPHVYIDIVLNHFVILPFLTRVTYHYLAVYLQDHLGAPWFLFLGVGGALLGLLIAVVWRAGSAARQALAIGLYSATIFVVTGNGTSDRIGGGERYFVASATMTVIALVVALDVFGQSGRRRLYRVTSVLLLLFGLAGVLDVARFFKIQQQPLHWRQQVAAWEQDPSWTFHNGPWFWNAPYHLPPRPLSLDLPYYTYDSIASPNVIRQLPPAWFGPYDESVEPKALTHPIDPLSR